MIVIDFLYATFTLEFQDANFSVKLVPFTNRRNFKLDINVIY
jgi:hypothetical protein